MRMNPNDDILEISDVTTNWREHRLQALTYLIDMDGKNILRLIESVSDHEGWVTVTWRVEPSNEEMNWVSSKWRDLNEEPNCSTHYYKERELTRYNEFVVA